MKKIFTFLDNDTILRTLFFAVALVCSLNTWADDDEPEPEYAIYDILGTELLGQRTVADWESQYTSPSDNYVYVINPDGAYADNIENHPLYFLFEQNDTNLAWKDAEGIFHVKNWVISSSYDFNYTKDITDKIKYTSFEDNREYKLNVWESSGSTSEFGTKTIDNWVEFLSSEDNKHNLIYYIDTPTLSDEPSEDDPHYENFVKLLEFPNIAYYKDGTCYIKNRIFYNEVEYVYTSDVEKNFVSDPENTHDYRIATLGIVGSSETNEMAYTELESFLSEEHNDIYLINDGTKFHKNDGDSDDDYYEKNPLAFLLDKPNVAWQDENGYIYINNWVIYDKKDCSYTTADADKFYYKTVSYDRIISETPWSEGDGTRNTVCLPFAYTHSDITNEENTSDTDIDIYLYGYKKAANGYHFETQYDRNSGTTPLGFSGEIFDTSGGKIQFIKMKKESEDNSAYDQNILSISNGVPTIIDIKSNHFSINKSNSEYTLNRVYNYNSSSCDSGSDEYNSRVSDSYYNGADESYPSVTPMQGCNEDYYYLTYNVMNPYRSDYNTVKDAKDGHANSQYVKVSDDEYKDMSDEEVKNLYVADPANVGTWTKWTEMSGYGLYRVAGGFTNDFDTSNSDLTSLNAYVKVGDNYTKDVLVYDSSNSYLASEVSDDVVFIATVDGNAKLLRSVEDINNEGYYHAIDLCYKDTSIWPTSGNLIWADYTFKPLFDQKRYSDITYKYKFGEDEYVDVDSFEGEIYVDSENNKVYMLKSYSPIYYREKVEEEDEGEENGGEEDGEEENGDDNGWATFDWSSDFDSSNYEYALLNENDEYIPVTITEDFGSDCNVTNDSSVNTDKVAAFTDDEGKVYIIALLSSSGEGYVFATESENGSYFNVSGEDEEPEYKDYNESSGTIYCLCPVTEETQDFNAAEYFNRGANIYDKDGTQLSITINAFNKSNNPLYSELVNDDFNNYGTVGCYNGEYVYINSSDDVYINLSESSNTVIESVEDDSFDMDNYLVKIGDDPSAETGEPTENIIVIDNGDNSGIYKFIKKLPLYKDLGEAPNVNRSYYAGTYTLVAKNTMHNLANYDCYKMNGTGTQFVAVSSNSSLQPFRACLMLPKADSAVPQLAICFVDNEFDDSATSVEGIGNKNNIDVHDIYSIDGTLARPKSQVSLLNPTFGLKKGIYVMNGKKFVVK